MKINNCKEITEAFIFCNKLIINALQYRHFCVLKVPVLHGKSAYIAAQNSRFCNAKQLLSLFACVFFTKHRRLLWLFIGLLLHVWGRTCGVSLTAFQSSFT